MAEPFVKMDVPADVAFALVSGIKSFQSRIGVFDVGEDAGVMIWIRGAQNADSFLHREGAGAGEAEGYDFHGNRTLTRVTVDIGVWVEHDGPVGRSPIVPP